MHMIQSKKRLVSIIFLLASILAYSQKSAVYKYGDTEYLKVPSDALRLSYWSKVISIDAIFMARGKWEGGLHQLQPVHQVGQRSPVGGVEKGGTHHQNISARSDNLGGVVTVDATIDNDLG